MTMGCGEVVRAEPRPLRTRTEQTRYLCSRLENEAGAEYGIGVKPDRPVEDDWGVD